MRLVVSILIGLALCVQPAMAFPRAGQAPSASSCCAPSGDAQDDACVCCQLLAVSGGESHGQPTKQDHRDHDDEPGHDPCGDPGCPSPFCGASVAPATVPTNAVRVPRAMLTEKIVLAVEPAPTDADASALKRPPRA